MPAYPIAIVNVALWLLNLKDDEYCSEQMMKIYKLKLCCYFAKYLIAVFLQIQGGKQYCIECQINMIMEHTRDTSFRQGQDNQSHANMLSEDKQKKYTAFFLQMASQMKKEGNLPRNGADALKLLNEVRLIFCESIIHAINNNGNSSESLIGQNANILNNIREAISEHIPESSIAFKKKKEASLEILQNSQNEKKSCQLKKNEGDKHKSLYCDNSIQCKKKIQIQQRQDDIMISNQPVRVENKMPNFKESNMKRNLIDYQKSLVQNSQLIDKRQRPKREQTATDTSEPYACQII